MRNEVKDFFRKLCLCCIPNLKNTEIEITEKSKISPVTIEIDVEDDIDVDEDVIIKEDINDTDEIIIKGKIGDFVLI